MLTVEENERLTHVGPGTPMGNVMRRYWHPIAATSELEREQVLAVRVLGENLLRRPGQSLNFAGEQTLKGAAYRERCRSPRLRLPQVRGSIS